MSRICICGGGSLGHVCAGVLASRSGVELNVYTQRPELWSHSLKVVDNDGREYWGEISCISSDPQQAMKDCDIVLLCLPGFAIEETLVRIKDFVGNAVVGSIVCSTGFFFVAHRILGQAARLFGFQRVPYIARTVEYGRSANLLGYKKQLAIAVENVDNAELFCKGIENLFDTPTRLLASHYEVSLTNSNPILHTGRLYSMWKDWDGEKYDHNILFYKEWTEDASSVLICMDNEFMAILDALPVTSGSIPSLLEYYESHDASSLTRKISSIEAFQTIKSPMKEVNGGWIPDFESRYFTEDFPFGLKIIVDLARSLAIQTPNLSKVLQWGMSRINQ